MTGQRCSKGKWKLRPYLGSRDPIDIVDPQGRIIACVSRGTYLEAGPNAQLIVAAVNACAAVNPDDPKAAAESITRMYVALNCWRDVYRTHVQKKPIEGKLDKAWKLTAQALGTADTGKEQPK